jgi:hypothetical protein
MSFITLAADPGLDGRHNVVGRVASGKKVRRRRQRRSRRRRSRSRSSSSS